MILKSILTLFKVVFIFKPYINFFFIKKGCLPTYSKNNGDVTFSFGLDTYTQSVKYTKEMYKFVGLFGLILCVPVNSFTVM